MAPPVVTRQTERLGPHTYDTITIDVDFGDPYGNVTFEAAHLPGVMRDLRRLMTQDEAFHFMFGVDMSECAQEMVQKWLAEQQATSHSETPDEETEPETPHTPLQ